MTAIDHVTPGFALPYVMLDEWSTSVLQHDPMRLYRAKRDASHQSVLSKYNILGFISSGTYGRVYKAQSLDEDGTIHAIKKFKPDKEGDVTTYTGISQSAIREIAVRVLLKVLDLKLICKTDIVEQRNRSWEYRCSQGGDFGRQVHLYGFWVCWARFSGTLLGVPIFFFSTNLKLLASYPPLFSNTTCTYIDCST